MLSSATQILFVLRNWKTICIINYQMWIGYWIIYTCICLCRWFNCVIFQNIEVVNQAKIFDLRLGSANNYYVSRKKRNALDKFSGEKFQHTYFFMPGKKSLTLYLKISLTPIPSYPAKNITKICRESNQIKRMKYLSHWLKLKGKKLIS